MGFLIGSCVVFTVTNRLYGSSIAYNYFACLALAHSEGCKGDAGTGCMSCFLSFMV